MRARAIRPPPRARVSSAPLSTWRGCWTCDCLSACRLVVDHVLGRGGELLVPLDDLVDGVNHVFLRDGFAARANRVHAGLGADGPQLGAWG